MRRLLCMVLALVFALVLAAPVCHASQQAPRIETVETVMGDNAVMRYPQLAGLPDEAAQGRINDDIVFSAQITSFFPVLMRQSANSFGLDISYKATLSPPVFSVMIDISGEMPEGRKGNRKYAMTYDLRTGERVPFSSIVKDEATAIPLMEDMLYSTLYDEMSGYMEYSALSPIPTESYYIDEIGVTLCYPYNQFSLISGSAGQAMFTYREIADLIDTDDESILSFSGLAPKALDDKEALALITEALLSGRLPDIPAVIGESLPMCIEKYRLLRDPDYQPGGRVYQLEAPEFRGVQLISDALTKGYDSSIIEGIQAVRCSLGGLATGKASMDACRALLGAPDSSVPFTEAMAYDYALPLGTADYYTFGDYQLRLYFTNAGTLYQVMLAK